MKKLIHRKSILRSLGSLLVLGLFLLLALGSVDVFLTDFLGFNSHHHTDIDSGDDICDYWIGAKDQGNAPLTITAKLDENGLWDGIVIIRLKDPETQTQTEIRAKFQNGYFNGEYAFQKSDGSIKKERYYYMDNQLKPEDSAQKGRLTEDSGFEQLNSHYGWRLDYLNAFGFSTEYVKRYMDTIDVLLADYSFAADEFDDFYEEVMDVLTETPYDSIIEINAFFSGIRGLDLIKRLEIRLAVIDYCRSPVTSTYEVISSTYPGILALLAEEEISTGDFEGFCNDLDDSIAVDGPFVIEDPFFIDSVDTRFYRAIMGIYNSGEESLKKSLGAANANWETLLEDPQKISIRALKMNKRALPATTSPEIAEMVLYTIFMQYLEGDVLKRSTWEAYLKQEGILSPPTVATILLEGLTASSASIEGFVLEDGGAEVSARGIVWATYYNPTLDDNAETQGIGMGKFTVNLSGLSEGETYYARAYATNSAGTVYGNCIRFMPTNTIGIEEATITGDGFDIYPNPASSYATLDFQLPIAETIAISIVDMSGRTVHRKAAEKLSAGNHQIMINVNELPDGVYHCQLLSRDALMAGQKLVVSH